MSFKWDFLMVLNQVSFGLLVKHFCTHAVAGLHKLIIKLLAMINNIDNNNHWHVHLTVSVLSDYLTRHTASPDVKTRSETSHSVSLPECVSSHLQKWDNMSQSSDTQSPQKQASPSTTSESSEGLETWTGQPTTPSSLTPLPVLHFTGCQPGECSLHLCTGVYGQPLHTHTYVWVCVNE